MKVNKFILAALLVIVSFLPYVPAKASAISASQSQAYYNNCTTRGQEQFLSSTAHQNFCACTAEQMIRAFTVEDVQAMGAPDPALARLAYNKMITEVYAPCMEEPTRAYHYNSGLTVEKVTALGKPERVCQCAADALAQYMRENGRTVFGGILKRNPNIIDPNAALFEDPEFQKVAAQRTMACIGR